MANELQGIFTNIARATGSIASKSANEEYVKSQEIKRALDHFKLEKDLENDLKISAIRDYNHEQNKIKNTNYDANIHTKGILDQAEAELSNPNLNKEQITNIKNSLENKLNDFNYTKSSNIYKETVLASLDALTNNKIDDLKVEKSINNLVSSLDALYKKNRRAGNYAGDKDGFYAKLDNANNLLKNERDRLQDTQVTRVKSFIDNLTKSEYIRESLESYDTDPNTAFMQFGKEIGQAEASAIQKVNDLWKNGRIDDAYTELGKVLTQKSNDRKNISDGLKNQIAAFNKSWHSKLTSNNNELQAISDLTPKNADGLNTRMNNAESFHSTETSDASITHDLYYEAVDKDLNEWLVHFKSDKKERIWEPGKAIVEEMSDLNDEGRTLYLAAKIRKEGKNYYWNDDKATPYKVNSKIVSSPSQFSVQNSMLSLDRINESIDNLAKLLDLKKGVIDKGMFRTKVGEEPSFDTQKRALFRKFAKLYDISQENPNHINNVTRDKNIKAIRESLKANDSMRYNSIIASLEKKYENLSLVPEKIIKETLEGLGKDKKDDFLDYLYKTQKEGGQNAR